jgi:hypothetical protein
MKHKLRNPETGNILDIDANHVAEALSDGLEPTGPMDLVNPETKNTISIAPERLREAVTDGLLVPGSMKAKALKMSGLEAGARRVGQGFTFGLQDEAAGALDWLRGKGYEQGRDESRENNEAATEHLGPELSTALDIAGGIGSSMLMPGSLVGRGLAAGSKAAIMRSAAQGALGGFGYSDAKDAGGVAMDTAIGGALGGAVEKVAPAVGRFAKRGVEKVGKAFQDAVDPGVQRILAAGGKAGDLRGRSRDVLLKGAQELSDSGFFRAGELESIVDDVATGGKLNFLEGTGSLPDKKALQERIRVGTQFFGSKLGQAVEQLDSQAQIPFVDLWSPELRKDLRTVLDRAQPSAMNKVVKDLGVWQGRIAGAEGRISALNKIRQDIAEGAGFHLRGEEKSASQKAATLLYGALNDAIDTKADEVARATGNAELTTLKNKFSALKNFDKLIERGIADEESSSKLLGFIKQKSMSAGAIGATTGASIGGAPGAGIGAWAGQAVDQYINSTEGRLARAALGEKIAAMLGKVPRTSAAVRAAIQANPGVFAPLVGPQMIQAIQKMPAKVWEEQSRVLMPILDQAGLFEHSDYPTELDGKVGDADKLVVSQQLEQKKLTPSQEYLRRNALVRDGSLPDELRPQTAQDIMKRMQDDALPMGVFGQNLAGY